MLSRAERRFIRLNLITIVTTLLVVLAGGVVRSTGSGMGCPDWPKCFGQYIPPTSLNQLPPDYQEKFVEQRVAKNERFAKTLDRMGRSHLADEIRRDQSIREPEVFNAAKTWTEYVNRLVGALTGLFMLALAIMSFIYRRLATRITVLSIVNIFVVGYQAWLGSIVVSTNLLAWIVTVHMLLALVILAIQVYTYNYAQRLHREPTVVMARVGWPKALLLLAIVISIVQIVLGTEVREGVDEVSRNMGYSGRESWLKDVGAVFHYHRDLAIAVLIVNIIIYKMVKDRFSGKAVELNVANGIAVTLMVQIVSGVVLANLALPPYAQGIHILFSTVLFTLQYYLYLLVYRTRTYQQNIS